jgi:hypothetical protein
VIPIILRPCNWKELLFSSLQVLPPNGKPVTRWKDRDEAFLAIEQGLRTVIDELASSEMDNPVTGSPIWNVPIPRNNFFTGRENVLQALHDSLHKQSSAILTQVQTQAISGLGGIGKTQTAVEYCYRYAEEYQAVLWTRAETELEIRTGFSEIAKALGLPEQAAQDPEKTVQAVKRWLEQTPGWLLVLDNADHPEILLPQPG